MDDDRTRGWLMARVELAVAVIAVLILPAWWIGQPGAMGALTFGSRPYQGVFDLFPIVAEVAMLLALSWMIRIWRGPTRESPPAWRYRDVD